VVRFGVGISPFPGSLRLDMSRGGICRDERETLREKELALKMDMGDDLSSHHGQSVVLSKSSTVAVGRTGGASAFLQDEPGGSSRIPTVLPVLIARHCFTSTFDLLTRPLFCDNLASSVAAHL